MRNLLIPAIALFLSACSGVKPYPDLPNKNFSVTTINESGSVLQDVKAFLDIYSVNIDCTTLYKGTVQLDKPIVEIALPPKQQSYLTFVFSASGTTAYSTLLQPKTGYRYLAEISYVDGIYNVVINEMNPAGRRSQELEPKDLNACNGDQL